MGRRSINTTKSGKYMNPTDQARKEARKKELKKNKKQRMMVRQAVLKGKDPVKLLEEMENIDKMEYDPTNPPKLNEKVLKDKRKKLKETFERVVRLYEREDPEYCMILKKEESEYYRRREKMITLYDQIKFTENVELSMIPMPDMPQETPTAQIPLPDKPQPGPLMPDLHPKGILKKTSAFHLQNTPQRPLRKPLGPPPGSPPELSDSEAEEEATAPLAAVPATALLQSYYNQPPVPGLDFESYEQEVEKPQAKQRKIRFHEDMSERNVANEESTEMTEEDLISKWLIPKPLPTPLQLKMLKMAGQQLPKPAAGLQDEEDGDDNSDTDDDTDDEKDKKKDDTTSSEETRTTKVSFEVSLNKATALSNIDKKIDNLPAQVVSPVLPGSTGVSTIPAPVLAASSLSLPPGPPPGVPPMMFRPPLPRPGVSGPPRMLPPGPPPGRPPGIPTGLPRGPLPRVPPGPPGMPPPRLMRANQSNSGMPPSGVSSQNMASTPHSHMMNPNVLSAPPSIMKLPKPEEEAKNFATIEAKPQIKHQIGDVTKFMPTSLRIKRDTKAKAPKAPKKNELYSVMSRPAPQVASQTKDDVYDMFMREMEDFL